MSERHGDIAAGPGGRPPAPEAASEIAAELARLADGDSPPPMRLGTRLRNYFLTGLVVVGPVTITLYIARYVIDGVDRWVKPYIPAIYNPDSYLPFQLPGFGLIFAIVMLTLIGALAANLIGRWIISAGEVMLDRTPLVRNIYRAIKQIFESVVQPVGPRPALQKVAVMEFPSKGIWALVFLTGAAAPAIRTAAPEEELVSVFMPTHFLPPSGFVVFVPKRNVIPVELTVEDAAKIIISAGMVTPGVQDQLGQLAEKGRAAPKAA